ncbi:MAG: hypothetical protein AB7T31_04255 [Gemmatimonadales bacterium]
MVADADAPAEATAEVRWRELGRWEGTGDRQTESFDVASGTLELVWEASRIPTAHDGAGRLRVSLYSAISGRPLQTIVDTVGVGAGSAYVADEPRVSYLVIESESLAWRVRLDEAVRAGSTH